MILPSFIRLADELAAASKVQGTTFPFIFLGASSDPAMIVDFSSYVNSWISSLPCWHPVKFYTHGWMLSNASQYSEFSKFIDVLEQWSSRITIMGLSLDIFSRLARRNWNTYLENAALNLVELARVVPKPALKLNVTYPVGRLNVSQHYTIGYWRDLTRFSACFPDDAEIDSTLNGAVTQAERECALLTTGVFRIGAVCGFDRKSTAMISRDNGVPFASGRARSLFRNQSKQNQSRALQHQLKHTLKGLNGFPDGNHGIVVMPDGRARLVNYLGYELGQWLGSGNPVIPYVTSYIREDLPWNFLDLSQTLQKDEKRDD